MASQQSIPVQSIPESLSHLIHLNEKYSVLICIGHGCRYAVSPTAISIHLQRKHKTQLELRRQVDRYIEQSPLEYDYSNIQLPVNGLAPQPIIKVVDGFQCRFCPFLTTDRSNIRKHGNKEHDKKRAADDDLFNSVRLQSWFGKRRERYWVVDESQPPEVDLEQGLESRAGETHTR